MADATTWIPTSWLDNPRAARDRGFRVIGMKESRRALAERIAPCDAVQPAPARG